MNKIITQKLKFKQSVIKYSFENSVAKAEKVFKVNKRMPNNKIKRI